MRVAEESISSLIFFYSPGTQLLAPPSPQCSPLIFLAQRGPGAWGPLKGTRPWAWRMVRLLPNDLIPAPPSSPTIYEP